MTAEAPARDHATLSHIALDQIRPDESFNPRSTMDDAQLAELAASVAQVGVIQPIIVTPDDPDGFRVVAGHRRLHAARTSELETIPALVYSAIDDQTRLQLAIIENLQREDINPVDEAAGYERAMKEFGLSQKQLAQMVGKSPSHISERLRLRKLPDACQRYIADGSLPLTVTKPLTQIAKVAPDVADGCARLVASGEADLDDLVTEPHFLVGQLAEVDWEDAPFVQPCRTYGPQPIRFRDHIPEDEVNALNSRAEALCFTRFAFDEEDINAARAYKCLLEFDGGYAAHRFITDARFAFDRVTQALDAAEATQAAQNAAEPPQEGEQTDIPDDEGSGDAVVRAHRLEERRRAREQAARQKEREQQAQARLDAISANRQLGLSLAKKLGSKKLDRDTAQLLARIVLDQNQNMAGRGMRYTHEDYHALEHVRQKNGKARTKFTPIEPHAAHEQLQAWVLRPKQPEEIIGRLLQAIVAGTFADQRAVAKSQQTHWHGMSARETGTLIAKLAIKILPDHFREAAQRMLPPKPARKPAPSKPRSKDESDAA